MDLVLGELGIGDRKKTTLTSLTDRNRSNSASGVTAANEAGMKRSVSIALALQQLHIAEKLMAAHVDEINANHEIDKEVEVSSHSPSIEEGLDACSLDDAPLVMKDTDKK